MAEVAARRRRLTPRVLFLCVCCVCASVRPAFSQCPDGTPPPCARARPVAVRAAPPPATERGRRFLILPFRNVTRAPEHEWLIEGSTTMLADALSRWQEITVVSDERLYPALRRHGLAPGSVMEPVAARRVAEETGGWTAVTGEVLATAGRVRVSARAYDVVTNRVLVRASSEVGASEDIRAAFEGIGAQLLSAAGLEGGASDLASATTRSLDAYRAYVRGLSHYRRSEYRRARAAFLDAVRLDSTFAQAYAHLASTALFMSPDAVLDARSPIYSYVERAEALSTRLPPRDRELVQALNAAFHGQLGAARQSLARRLERDSNDVEATVSLADLEYFDLILVGVAGHERPRGSLNASARLHKRALELDPARRSQYLSLAYIYLQAGGELPGLVPGFRREATSLPAMIGAGPDRVFVPVMRDTIELVPAESLETVPRDSLAAAQRRARDAARAWVSRWLAAGATDAEAHRMASRIHELDGELEPALEALAAAESLGVETAWEAVPARRMVLYLKLRRVAEARRLADSLASAAYFDSVSPVPSVRLEAPVWAFNLFMLAGEWERADALVGHFREALGAAIGLDTAMAGAWAGAILSGATFRPFYLIELPAAFRLEALDSALARVGALEHPGLAARSLPQLLTLASAAADQPARTRLAARAMDAAFALAGRDPAATAVARQLASVAVRSDETLRSRLAGAAWYSP